MEFTTFSTYHTTQRRRQWQPTPVLLPGKSHGWRNLVGCSPWGREESDMTERLHFHFPLSCIGEGNSNPLQCSCLENPMDGEAWWAAVYGVAQSRTRLKRLSSSSSTRPRSCQLSIVWERHDEGSLQGNVMRVSPYPLGHRTYIESETLYGMVLPVGRTHGFEDYGVKRDLFIITLRDPLCNPLYKPLCLNSR